MSHTFQSLCIRLSDSIKKMPFQWTSIWEIGEGSFSIITTKGDIWATKTITFRDDKMYGGTRQIEDLMRDEYVTEVQVEQTLSGPRLKVITRHDT